MTTYQTMIRDGGLGLAVQPTILIYALWRSGTHWLSEMVSDLTGLPSFYHAEEGAPYGDETLEQINQHRENTVLIRHLCASPDRLLRHTEALNIPVILLFRDPRDVIASQVNMRKHREGYRPGLPPFPDMPLDAILDWELANHGDVYHRLLPRWAGAAHPTLLTVRYEDLLSDVQRELARVAVFLNLDVSLNEIRRVAARHVLPGLMPATGMVRAGESARRGAIGDYRHQFTLAQQRRLTDALLETLVKLGYECGPSAADAG